MTVDPLIYVRDIRDSGHCPRGIKAWCELNGIDFKVWVKQGMPASKLRATGCGLAVRCVEETMARRQRNG